MIIKELQMIHFGKFHHKTIDLRGGMNIIYGGNEAGKTTVYRFIKAMLFGVERMRGRAASNDEYTRMEPWENDRGYEGIMILEQGGTSYRLYRNFYKESQSFKAFIHETGEEVVLPSGSISDLIPGLTKSNFSNTVALGQQETAIEGDFAQGLQSYVANMATTGHEDINIASALAYLKKEEKHMKAKLPSERLTRLKQELARLETDKAQLERHQRAMVEGKAQIGQLEKEMQAVRAKIEEGKIQQMAEGQLETVKEKPSVFRQPYMLLFILAVILVAVCLVNFLRVHDIILVVVGVVAIALAVFAFLKIDFSKKEDPTKDKDTSRDEGLLARKEQLEHAIETQKEQVMKHQWSLEQLEEKASQRESVYEEYREMMQESAAVQKELRAMSLAGKLIGELTGAIHQQFGTRLNTEMAKVFEEISGTNHKRFIVDEKLNIHMDGMKQLIPMDRMSAGAVEQIYFALRFCAGDLIFNGEEMPLILDDSFAYYDQERLTRMLRWLVGEKCAQIIVFTCHHREAECLETIGEDYNYIEL